jgi:ketosteroid isomerase-like protein
MKRILWAAIIFIGVLAFWSCSETKQAPPSAGVVPSPVISAAAASTENVEAEVTRSEREWAAAIVNKDFGALDRLLADDFNGTSPTAYTFPKTSALEDLKSGKYVVDTMNLDEISVNVYGNTAVSFTSQLEKSKYAGKDTSGHYHFTDVWIKKDGRWQVVASHGSRFNEPHKEINQ